MRIWRRVRNFSSTAFLSGAGVFQAVVAAAGGDSYPSYDEVPLVVGDIEPIRVLMHDSRDHACRLLVLGDSQETSPGGYGRTYVPHLQSLLASISGGVDRTPIRGSTSTGSGSPPAGWLSSSSAVIGMPNEPGIDEQFLLPGQKVVLLSPTEFQPGDYGPRFTLVHDGAGTANPSWVPGASYIDPDDVSVEFFVASWGGASSRLEVLQRPTDALTGWAPPTRSEIVELVPSERTPGILVGTSQRLDRASRKYNQVEIRPVEGESDLVLIGVRYREIGRVGGLGASVHSKGGNSIRRFLAEHGESGWLLGLDTPSVVLLQFGANDVRGRSAAEFEADTRTFVDWIRASLDSPCLPIIMLSDPWQDVGPELAERQDEYPAALASIADDTAGVVAINLRLALEQRHGWGPENRSFLTDLVHLTDEAQALSAEMVFELIIGDRIRTSPADLNADGCVNGEDFGLLLERWRSEPSPCVLLGDLDRDGRVRGSDLGLLFEAWYQCPSEEHRRANSSRFEENGGRRPR